MKYCRLFLIGILFLFPILTVNALPNPVFVYCRESGYTFNQDGGCESSDGISCNLQDFMQKCTCEYKTRECSEEEINELNDKCSLPCVVHPSKAIRNVGFDMGPNRSTSNLIIISFIVIILIIFAIFLIRKFRKK